MVSRVVVLCFSFLLILSWNFKHNSWWVLFVGIFLSGSFLHSCFWLCISDALIFICISSNLLKFVWKIPDCIGFLPPLFLLFCFEQLLRGSVLILSVSSDVLALGRNYYTFHQNYAIFGISIKEGAQEIPILGRVVWFQLEKCCFGFYPKCTNASNSSKFFFSIFRSIQMLFWL